MQTKHQQQQRTGKNQSSLPLIPGNDAGRKRREK